MILCHMQNIDKFRQHIQKNFESKTDVIFFAVSIICLIGIILYSAMYGKTLSLGSSFANWLFGFLCINIAIYGIFRIGILCKKISYENIS